MTARCCTFADNGDRRCPHGTICWHSKVAQSCRDCRIVEPYMLPARKRPDELITVLIGGVPFTARKIPGDVFQLDERKCEA